MHLGHESLCLLLIECTVGDHYVNDDADHNFPPAAAPMDSKPLSKSQNPTFILLRARLPSCYVPFQI